MRRHVKASSAGSNMGAGKGRALIGRALAFRGSSCEAEGSGTPSRQLRNLALVAALAALALLFVAAPASARPIVFDFFGHTGAGAGQFGPGVIRDGTLESPAAFEAAHETGPVGTAVNDTTGDVYVADRLNNRIDQFDSDHNFIRAWGVDVISGGATGTGDLTNESKEVTSVVTTSRAFVVGQEVSGTGIPAGTTITKVGTGTGTDSKLVLSSKATASGSSVTITAAEGTGNIPQNEIQKISVKAAAGDYVLNLATTMPTAEATTADIPFNATAAEVQSALAALANVGAGNVEVSGAAGGPYTVEFKGTRFADTNVAQLERFGGSTGLSGPPGPAFLIETIQEGAGRFEKCTATTTCQAGNSSGAAGGLNHPTGVGVNQSNQNVYVAEFKGLRMSQFEADGDFVRTSGADVVASGPDNEPEVQSIKVSATGGTFALNFEFGENSGTTATGSGDFLSGSNEITSVTTTGGVFTVGKEISGEGIPAGTEITAVEPGKLTISNNTTEEKTGAELTANLPFDASAATVEAALNALNTVDGAFGSVSVSGGPGDASGSNPYQVTFGGALAAEDLQEIQIDPSGLVLGVGSTVSCNGGPASGATVSYQWLRDGVEIPGATSPTYSFAAADEGKSVQCRVKASNADGATLQVAAPTIVPPVPATVPPVPPASIAAPSGGATVGSTLTCEPEFWNGSPSFGYQWLRNGNVIGGATAETYTLVGADNQTAIQCLVTGTNAGGAAVVYSEAKIIRSEPAGNTAGGGVAPIPLITPTGPGNVGELLSCSTGTWTGPPATFSYEWLRNGNAIGGATANTYTTVGADAGKAIQCKVIGTGKGAAGAVISRYKIIAPVPSPLPPSRPSNVAATVSGERNVGKTLTCAATNLPGFPTLEWTPNPPEPTFSYRWLRNGAEIAGATGAEFTLTAADLDKLVQCMVIGTNPSGSSAQTSASQVAGATVVAPPAATASIAAPSAVTTTTPGANAEVCNAGVDICKAGIGPGPRLGGTFASVGGNATPVSAAVAVAPGGPYAGDVFVTDIGNARVQIFNPDTGQFVATFGKEVLQSGPETVGKNVCIASLGDICKAGLSVSGNSDKETYGFGSVGAEATGYQGASALAIDGNGAVYATSPLFAYLQKYSPDLNSEHDFAPYLCSTSVGNNTLPVGCSAVGVDPHSNEVYIAVGIPGQEERCTPTCHLADAAIERMIVKLDSSGSEPPLETNLVKGLGIRTIGAFAFDGSIGNERSGRIYFTTDTPESRVDVFGEAPAPDFVFDPIEVADVGSKTVKVSGTINPNGNSIHTTYRFETLRQGDLWRPFPVPSVDVGNGNSPVPVEETITGLRPNTNYRIRLAVSKGGDEFSPEQTFTTLPNGPDVETGPARWSGPPASSPSLTFSGTVDSNNKAVSYFFEYGTDSSYGKRVPLFESAVEAAGQEPFLARQTVTGLDPNATYHYRIGARTEAGLSFGADEEVEPAQAGGRFPELVSPAAKGVGRIGVTLGPAGIKQRAWQAAASGNGIAYMFEYGDTKAFAGGELLYSAKRGSAQWDNEQLNPPSTTEPTTNYPYTQASTGLIKWVSPELNCSFLQSYGDLTADTPKADVENKTWRMYRRNGDGSFTLITPTPLNNANNYTYKVRGATADCTRVIFQTDARLLPEAPDGKRHIYEWEETSGGGTLRTVDVLPDGTVPPEGGLKDAGIGFEMQGGEVELNSVSQPDASRAFFFATSNEGGDSGKKAIFLRENHATTIDVSQSQTAVPNDQDSRYQMASLDGSRVFFTTKAGIANNSVSTTGNSLYSYDVDSGVLSDLTPDSNPADTDGASIGGVLGASEDGSHVYLAAKGQLVPGKGKTYAENSVGSVTYNVYVAHAGVVDFAGLATRDDMNVGGLATCIEGISCLDPPGNIQSRVTPDGNYLLFRSSVNLTPYDSEGVQEIYRYSLPDDEVQCVSCREDGQPPLGASVRSAVFSAPTSQGDDSYQPRAMTEDGSRIFFSSTDKLTPDAIGGQELGSYGAYEWHDGDLQLLAARGRFIDIGADGNNAFVLSDEALVPQDRDGVNDVYDFRIDGGFPYSPTEACDPLTDGSCQGTPPTPPTPGADPASGSFNGPGNPPARKPKPGKCKKGQVRRHGKCVKKPHKGKKGKKKAGKRAAKSNRGGSK